MTDRNDFLSQMKDLVEYGRAKDDKLTKKEVKEYFEEMNLTTEQLNLVYDYLREHNITVGTQKKKTADEPLNSEDSVYLKVYKRELNQLDTKSEEELEQIYNNIRQGKVGVVNEAVEAHLKRIVTLATKYKNRGVPLEDLIQEGNLALISIVNDMLGDEEIDSHRKEIDRRIKRCLIDMIDEYMDMAGKENSMLAKTNLIYEATKVLAQDLGRVATVEELAAYTKLEEDEILDFVEISVDEIHLGAGGEQHHHHDHNCDCDHHHDHNCDCDHHHDHNCDCNHHDHDCDCGHHHE